MRPQGGLQARIGLGLIAADIGCMEMPGSTSQHAVLAA